MKTYLSLLSHILDTGLVVPTRAVLKSTGRPITAITVFGTQHRYSLHLFPLLTTKKMFFRGIVEELCWFLRGSTDARELQERNVHIWDEWADPQTGDVGPVYGKLWRDFHGVDQIARLIEDLEEVAQNPGASPRRRLIITAWDPSVLHLQKLPCCHVMAQFNVIGTRLHCMLTQRSADAFLGVPFNIASYALLTYILAARVGLKVGELVHSIGDAHIYSNHVEPVREQLERVPYARPNLDLLRTGKSLGDLRDLTPADFMLIGYQSHPALKGEVAV